MRSILAALALSILPSAAFAECGCVCQGGQAVGVCSLAYETPPVCQRLCTPSLTRTIGTPALSTAINPGGVYAPPGMVRGNPAAGAAGSLGGGGGALNPYGATPGGAYDVSPTGSNAVVQPF